MSTSATLPAGSRLWDAEGIPVAEIPTPNGGLGCWAFDYADHSRRFPFNAIYRNGAGITPEDWDALVAVCHRGCQPWLQRDRTGREGLLRTREVQIAYRAFRRKLDPIIDPRIRAGP
jgi:hypothetical protein